MASPEPRGDCFRCDRPVGGGGCADAGFRRCWGRAWAWFSITGRPKLGGVAHIVLPRAPGNVDHPGKYADTAIPALIAELTRRAGAEFPAAPDRQACGRGQHVSSRFGDRWRTLS